MIESCLFLPQKKKLMETKDKEMEDQACHIRDLHNSTVVLHECP